MDLLGLFGKASLDAKTKEDAPQGDDDKAIVAYVERKLDDSRSQSARIASEGVWLTNAAWLIGYQSMFWDANTRSFRNRDAPFGGRARRRMQTNRILPAVQNRTARLCKSPPKYEVRPNTNEVEDKEATMLGKMVIDHIWDVERIQKKRIDLTMWAQQCGHSYIKVSFDTKKGKKIVDPTTGETMNEGDISVEIAPAFEIYPDPLAKTLDECSYIVHTKVRPLEYFRMHYPLNGHLVKEEATNLLGLQYQQRINAMSQLSGEGTSGAQKNSAVEKALYEAPSSKYPEGRMIITASGIKLEDKPLPCGEIPYVKFDDIAIGSKYYSEAIITHARAPQERINTIINQRFDWIKKLLAGKYAAAKGTNISAEALNDLSGELLLYDAVPNAPDGGRPSAMQVPMMPSYAYTEEEKAQNDLYEIMGLSEISRGSIPAAGIPAVGMQILLEADESRIGVITQGYELGWAKVGQLILKYAQVYYTEPRLLKQSGNQGYLVKSFVGADLRDNFDVIVVPGSTVPNSTALKRQEMLNLYSQGLLGDPNDPSVKATVLDSMQFGDLAKAWRDRILDEQQIKKVIEEIENEIMPVLTEYDNAGFWLQELNRYRKSEKYPKLSDMSRLIFDHVMHQCTVALLPPQLQNETAPTLPQEENAIAEGEKAASDLRPEELTSAEPPPPQSVMGVA